MFEFRFRSVTTLAGQSGFFEQTSGEGVFVIDRSLASGFVADFKLVATNVENVAGEDPLLIAAFRVHSNAVRAAKVLDVPVAVNQLQLAVM